MRGLTSYLRAIFHLRRPALTVELESAIKVRSAAMKIIGERAYACSSGETITVNVTSSGNTAHLVNFNLDAAGGGSLPEGQPLHFPMNKPHRTLRLLFTFSGNDDTGKYDVSITGSGGGHDTDQIAQSFGIPSDQRRYDFWITQQPFDD